jgi:hypothetical protein
MAPTNRPVPGPGIFTPSFQTYQMQCFLFTSASLAWFHLFDVDSGFRKHLNGGSEETGSEVVAGYGDVLEGRESCEGER